MRTVLIIAFFSQYATPKQRNSKKMTACNTVISTNELEVRYGNTVALTDVNLEVP